MHATVQSLYERVIETTNPPGSGVIVLRYRLMDMIDYRFAGFAIRRSLIASINGVTFHSIE
jgi:hypothetical protein